MTLENGPIDKPHDLTDISEGARELLRIAVENDRHHGIAFNAALLSSFSWLSQLRAACQDHSDRSLNSLLRVEVLPKSFLALVSLIIERIRADLDVRYLRGDGTEAYPLVTDFDRHVLQALAETLADAAWPERAASDFDGPPISRVKKFLGAIPVSVLYETMLRNYIGNILQDVFAAARIRQTVRNLAPETEDNLRTQDGAMVAASVMAKASPAGQAPEPDVLVQFLDSTIREACR